MEGSYLQHVQLLNQTHCNLTITQHHFFSFRYSLNALEIHSKGTEAHPPLGIKLNKSLYKIGVLYSPVFNNQNTKLCINLVIRSSAETADLADKCIMKPENAQIMKYVLYMYKTQKKKVWCHIVYPNKLA